MEKKAKAEEVWKRIFPAKVGDLIETSVQNHRGKHIPITAKIVEEDSKYYTLEIVDPDVRGKLGWHLNVRPRMKKDVRRYKILLRSWELENDNGKI